MLTVGASRQTALRALASSASRAPALAATSCEKEAPMQVALGSAVAGAGSQLRRRTTGDTLGAVSNC